jgi:hypothetical protein
MLQFEQHGSAIDLFSRLVQVLDLQQLPVEDCKRVFVELFYHFPLNHSSCDQFVRLVLKWSMKHCSEPNGDPVLHHVFGAGYFKGSLG